MALNNGSYTPLYAQVEAILVANIADGTYPVGGRIPKEEDLIERFDVSRTTIRQTIQNLIRRGLVEIAAANGLMWRIQKSGRSLRS